MGTLLKGMITAVVVIGIMYFAADLLFEAANIY